MGVILRRPVSRFHYRTDQPGVLRLQSNGLAETLDLLSAALDGRTLNFDDIQEDFQLLYQPDALALIEAMLHYVPNDDPRIMVEFSSGDYRQFKSDDVRMTQWPLSKETASTQLTTVAKKLRALTGYLPRTT